MSTTPLNQFGRNSNMYIKTESVTGIGKISKQPIVIKSKSHFARHNIDGVLRLKILFTIGPPTKQKQQERLTNFTYKMPTLNFQTQKRLNPS